MGSKKTSFRQWFEPEHEFRFIPPSCRAVAFYEGGSLTKADKIAGISPYEGRGVDFFTFSFIDNNLSISGL